MKLKTSLFNTGIILEDLRRFIWFGVAYLITLLFVFPLQIIIISGKEDVQKYYFDRLFYYSGTRVENFLILVVPVLLGILIFRYIQVKNSTDAIHSLPIKRTTLYSSHIFVGASLLIVPVVIAGVCAMIIYGVMDLGKFYHLKEIWNWIGITILFDMVFFLFSVLFGMVTGLSTIQGAFTYIFAFLPLGLFILLAYNLKAFLYGFTFNFDKNSDMYSPIIRVLNGFNDNFTSAETAVYVLICIAVLFLAGWLYNKRKLEAASESIAFKSLKNIFIYGVTLCTALLAGAYFQRVQNYNIKWIIFGYFIGSFAGYFIAQMVANKSLYVFKTYKGYLISLGVIVIILIGFKFDIAGYEKRVPELSNIKSVYFRSGLFNFEFMKNNIDVFYDKKNIETIYSFHKQLIADRDKNMKQSRMNESTIDFVYKLSNGSTLTREYAYLPSEYSSFFKPVRESMEYKKMVNPILNMNDKNFDKIIITPSYKNNTHVTILEPSEITGLVNSIKKDIINETYEQMTQGKEPWADIDLLIHDDNIEKYNKSNESDGTKAQEIHISFKKSNTYIENWLNSKGYLPASRVMPSDIDHISVLKVSKVINPDSLLKLEGQLNKKYRIEIKDKTQIEKCLTDYAGWWNNDDSSFKIIFYGKNGNIWYGCFKNDSIPDFIENYFTK